MSTIVSLSPTRRLGALSLVVLGCLGLILLWSVTASATVLKLSSTELTDTAQTVVIVKALATDSRWTDPSGTSLATKGTIVTDVRLAVYEVLKGDAAAFEQITVPGGAVGDVSMPIPDAPRFVAGRMYVVFLSANGSVISWRVGQPRIVGDEVPALKTSLAGLKSSVARQVGHTAEVLRPWSGVAPSARLDHAAQTPPPPVTGAAISASPSGTATRAVGGVKAPALMAPPTAPMPPAVGTRTTSTLFADDFDSMTSSPWSILSSQVNDASQWGLTQWVTDSDQLYQWAYSAAYEWWNVAGTWLINGPYLFYPGSSTYGNNSNTWMVAGPINLTAWPHAVVDFDLWCDLAGGDVIDFYVSSNYVPATGAGSWEGPYWYGQEGQQAGGDPPSFASWRVDLERIPYDASGNTHNYCGRSNVYIAFAFTSNTSGVDTGACVDDVIVRGSTAPFPPKPVITSITPSSAPAGTYKVATRNQSRVTINGTGFGATQGTNGAVAFFYQDGEPLIAGIVRSWSDTQIVCDVPIGTINDYAASAGSGPVCVRSNTGGWSNEVSFDVPFSYGAQEWEASRCLYRVNMDASRQAAVDAATAAWNAIGTQMQFQNVGACTTMTIGTGNNTHMPLDGHNDMCFDSLPWPGVIACAWPIAVKGRMLETDICFNTTGGFAWGDANYGDVMDIETITAHETGHWLNLRDLYGPGDTGRVMFGFCGTGVVKRVPTSGDRAGIQWIYTDNGLDTLGPVARARSLTVTRGRTAKVQYNIDDPAPSIGVSSCKVQIKNRAGKVVKTLNTAAYTRMWNAWSFRCRLARGRYSIVVTGTDILGYKSTRSVKGYLTVR